ncbi:hypothetical protein WJX81_008447 [Elliptochloris bilobata]|uniref:Uncharacterized protein n=1 Tax=Elliptochloris bilobata TaxID=381761 RepID=A0AAW1S9P8_9CHLO
MRSGGGGGSTLPKAPALARLIFPRALWVRVAVLVDGKTAVASGNLLESADVPSTLSVLAVPRLPTSALLRGEVCIEAFGDTVEVISAPILDRCGDVCGAVLIGVPVQPRTQELQLLLVRAERFARILASAKLASRCYSLVTNLRSYVARGSDGCERIRKDEAAAGPAESCLSSSGGSSDSSMGNARSPAATKAAQLVPRDMLGVLLFHLLHYALLSDAARRAVFLNSGYLWVYGVVCLAHTLFYVFAPMRFVHSMREKVVLAFSVLIVSASSYLSAAKMAAVLAPAQHNLLWCMRSSLMEFPYIFMIIFPTRFVAALPVRVLSSAIALYCMPEVCQLQYFRELFAPHASCLTGGQVLLALVGTAVPLAITWVLERHARMAFQRRLV